MFLVNTVPVVLDIAGACEVIGYSWEAWQVAGLTAVVREFFE